MLSTVTSASLLAGLSDPRNQTAWRQYVERYRPLLVRYARRVGVAANDAEDLAQQILMKFSRAYRAGEYDRERGRLRSWLFGIAAAAIQTYWRGRGRDRSVDGDTDLFANLEDRGRLDELWEAQWRDAVLAACLREVRAEVEPKTFQAFDLFVCQGLSGEVVADRLGTSENAVFCAKQRVLRRLRELRPRIEDAF